jgi:hypothetical protein
MTDSNKKALPSIPTWQMASKAPDTSEQAVIGTDDATVEQARRFLRAPEVQNTTREKKAHFLRLKGFQDSVIDALLSEDSGSEEKAVVDVDVVPQPEAKAARASDQVSAAAVEEEAGEDETGEDQTPIITYPEFLTRRPRPSLLITMDGFFNTLYAMGSLSALLYGTSKLVLLPMVSSLTEARVDLHETAADDLAKLVEKLEDVVSEVPAHVASRSGLLSSTAGGGGEHGIESPYEDPTELFHRDVGVQTSLTVGINMGATGADASAEKMDSLEQAQRIASLAADVRNIYTGLVSQSGELVETAGVLGVLQDDLGKLRVKAPTSAFAGLGGFAPTRPSEPDDEISRARDNIRRMKGILLSARHLPGTVR